MVEHAQRSSEFVMRLAEAYGVPAPRAEAGAGHASLAAWRQAAGRHDGAGFPVVFMPYEVLKYRIYL